ncbi:MAG: DNA replication and repair protein RecF [Verrucomicrobia bacterium]|nr:DNA replication and repair protein RecF [Verrucomicrobiota bacterium]
MLSTLKLRDFRCFPALEAEFAPGSNVIVGPNAQGKTSLLEAACVLLRLQSPRAATLGPLVRLGAAGFVVDGFYSGNHLQFYYSPRRKKLALDSVEQRTAAEYLQLGRVVWFSNADIALVRGAADERRRYLDFVAAQLDSGYRRHLRDYEKALRSRNRLLKMPNVRWREIAAFDEPLVAAGDALTQARARLVATLEPYAAEAQRAIGGGVGEMLSMRYEAGSGGTDFAVNLAARRMEDQRLRQTTVGPHRDEVILEINGHGCELASEGQQRTLALALRLAQARLIAAQREALPLLLLDDIFGELDPARRNALLAHLPAGAQKIITTTHLDWAQTEIGRVFHLENRVLTVER